MKEIPSSHRFFDRLSRTLSATFLHSSCALQDQIWFPSVFAVCVIHSPYSVNGVTPVRPPQPAEFPGPVDQLTTPMRVKRPPAARKTGAPESPVQAPSPALSPLVAGCTRRICKVPGRPVATSVAARTVPPDLPSPLCATPAPATRNSSP